MRLALTERFQKDLARLTQSQRAQVFEALLGLPAAFREPHRHSGLGLRKVHPRGIWEARIGLGLRLVLASEADTAVLMRVAGHDEIRRFLREL